MNQLHNPSKSFTESPDVNDASIVSPGNMVKALKRIHDPEVNIAVFQRTVDHLENALQALLEIDISISKTGTPIHLIKSNLK